MNIEKNKSESGQAIVYLVIGLVVFLGFVALAIDGGMALADRRNVQNAADAASLAGGAAAGLYLENKLYLSCNEVWSCGSNFAYTAEDRAVDGASYRAEENGFIIDTDLDRHHGVDTFCGVIDDRNTIEVTVEMSATTPSNFLQLIFPNALHNEVEAVTHVYPGGPLAMGNAVVALNPGDCTSDNGAVFKGTGDFGVIGGGVWSNGCLKGAGQPTITISDSLVEFGYAGTFIPGQADWTPQPPSSPSGAQLPTDSYQIDINLNECDDWDMSLPNNGTVGPGLHCFHGDLDINNNQVIIGTGVTFYVEGNVKFNGGATVDLSAPTADNGTGAIPGVLLYVPHLSGHSCADQTIDMEGNNETHIQGVVYAPCSMVTLTGTEDSYLVNSQIIGWNVKVSGTAKTTVEYDGCLSYMIKPSIELYR